MIFSNPDYVDKMHAIGLVSLRTWSASFEFTIFTPIECIPATSPASLPISWWPMTATI